MVNALKEVSIAGALVQSGLSMAVIPDKAGNLMGLASLGPAILASRGLHRAHLLCLV